MQKRQNATFMAAIFFPCHLTLETLLGISFLQSAVEGNAKLNTFSVWHIAIQSPHTYACVTNKIYKNCNCSICAVFFFF